MDSKKSNLDLNLKLKQQIRGFISVHKGTYERLNPGRSSSAHDALNPGRSNNVHHSCAKLSSLEASHMDKEFGTYKRIEVS